MCGIAGIINLEEPGSISVNELQLMNHAQFHRGPDQGSEWIENRVGFAHRRLSILDLSDAGRQPMKSADESLIVAFNGEIYNFQEIRSELEAEGHSFKTGTDTEVILQAWGKWGVESLKKLQGMFAIALYDSNKNEVFLVRDRVGIKPLHYKLDTNRLVFSSELKSIEALCKEELSVDSEAVLDYFSLGYVPDPKCIYAEVKKLLPGHYIKICLNDNSVQTRCYWKINFSEKREAESEEQLLEEFTSEFDKAVNSHLVSDVPLGAFLSGGVDSSSVVASMANIGVENINTCSIGFDVESYDETEYAREVAKRYQTNHHEKIVQSSDIGLVEKLINIFDEPYADSSALPTFRVCEAARENVTVCLSGDGGDELLGGYRRHRFHHAEESVRGKIPKQIRGPLFGTLGWLYPKMDWAPQFLRAKSTFQGLSLDAPEAYFKSVSHNNYQDLCGLFTSDFVDSLEGYQSVELFRDVASGYEGDDSLAEIQHIDFHTWLPGDILTKTDRTSMAHSLEVRVPFLDHKFIEWCAKIPTEFLISGGQGKYVLKKSMEERLSNDVLYRKKMGFDVPISEWFKRELVELLRDRLLHGKMADLGVFKPKSIEKLITEHVSGLREHKRILWALLMFAEFVNK